MTAQNNRALLTVMNRAFVGGDGFREVAKALDEDAEK